MYSCTYCVQKLSEKEIVLLVGKWRDYRNYMFL